MEELYRQNAKIVYHFLYSRCHDADLAEELTQETFLQAYQSIHRFNGECKVSVWLCQIAKHLLYQYFRKHAKEIPTELAQEELPAERAAEERVLTKLELLDVLKEMQKLPAQIREVMYLRITGDLSFREIGDILGRNENWARVSFYRGKAQLLQMIEDKDKNGGCV